MLDTLNDLIGLAALTMALVGTAVALFELIRLRERVKKLEADAKFNLNNY
jgi:hypothetical protein